MIGGVSVKEQISALNSGIDVVVGTPGRLEDLIQGGKGTFNRDTFGNF